MPQSVKQTEYPVKLLIDNSVYHKGDFTHSSPYPFAGNIKLVIQIYSAAPDKYSITPSGITLPAGYTHDLTQSVILGYNPLVLTISPTNTMDNGVYTVPIIITFGGLNNLPNLVYPFNWRFEVSTNVYSHFFDRCKQYVGDLVELDDISTLLPHICDISVRDVMNRAIGVHPIIAHRLGTPELHFSSEITPDKDQRVMYILRKGERFSTYIDQATFTTIKSSSIFQPTLHSPVFTYIGNTIKLLPEVDAGKEDYVLVHLFKYGKVNINNSNAYPPIGYTSNLPTVLDEGLLLTVSIYLLQYKLLQKLQQLSSIAYQLPPLINEQGKITNLELGEPSAELYTALEQAKSYTIGDEDTELTSAELQRAKTWLDTFISTAYAEWNKKLEAYTVDRTSDSQRLVGISNLFTAEINALVAQLSGLNAKLEQFYANLRYI